MSGVRQLPPPKGNSKWRERWAVDSDGLDNEYTVALDAHGNYGCSCPAWKFQRKKMQARNPDWQCKHIDAVQAWREHSFNQHHEPTLNEQIADLNVLLRCFREAVDEQDFDRVGELRKRLEGYRGLTETCTTTIGDAIALAEQQLLSGICQRQPH